MNLQEAIECLTTAVKEKDDYAYVWHSNMATSVYDSLPATLTHEEKIEVGNQAATRFMSTLFGVKTCQGMLLGER